MTLVLCQTSDGWSLHAPGSTDADIASGDAPLLAAGLVTPDTSNYIQAVRVHLTRLVAVARAATSLTQLRDAMNAFEAGFEELLAFDSDADFANEMTWAGLDMADLPNFSTDGPVETTGIWSWDDAHLLECNDHVWSISERAEGDNRATIQIALVADAAALTNGIMRLFNCHEAEVETDGSVWIADPQSGHWLKPEHLAEVAAALRKGDI